MYVVIDIDNTVVDISLENITATDNGLIVVGDEETVCYNDTNLRISQTNIAYKIGDIFEG